MEQAKAADKSSTGRVKADKARIDRLKEQLRSTPAEVDFERIRIMEEVTWWTGTSASAAASA